MYPIISDMRLYLVQHGHALTKDIDPGRSLSSEGLKEVQSMATHMYVMRVPVDKIYHSGKMRAHQTAETFAETLIVNDDVIAIDGIDPKDSVEAFAKKIANLKPNTMIVGHLPFMAKLVSLLVTGKEEPVLVAYRPASVVCLVQDEQKHWHIGWMLRPDCC
ncbi:MAG: phosphohistidine phosphatase SixA [Gammaproteobacteria bacterium]|jgi:phosphohistidine phosphatase|nr:phosphohistidine phosphatase SixA [Gammaproteobacteria bacterium]